jgi:hypothetical protein
VTVPGWNTAFHTWNNTCLTARTFLSLAAPQWTNCVLKSIGSTENIPPVSAGETGEKILDTHGEAE